MAGLSAYLAYRPWESPEKSFAYTHAVVQKRVPLAPNVWEEYLLLRRVREVAEQPEGTPFGYGERSDHPMALPSQIYEETVEEVVAERAKLNKREREIREREEQAS